MMTREEILEIDQYCQEHRISYKQRLEELEIPFWNFYKAKKKYRLEDESSNAGEFVQLTPGSFASGIMPVRNVHNRKSATRSETTSESYLTIEMRTPKGIALRIQGNMTAAHLRELISGSNV